MPLPTTGSGTAGCRSAGSRCSRSPAGRLGIVLTGLAVLLFPYGRLPSPRWRWVLWLYLAAATLYLVGVLIASIGAIAGDDIRVDASGNLLVLSHPTGSSAWWGVVEAVFLPVLVVCWAASVAGQAASYRRSSGERRQQLKWLLAGSAIAGAGILLAIWLSAMHGILAGVAAGIAGACGQLGIPVCMGVAILRYRLFDIDRVISRRWPMRSSPACWAACTPGWYCWPPRSSVFILRWRWPRPRWPRWHCSARYGGGCSVRWTGGSTGPDMTPTRQSPPSRPS